MDKARLEFHREKKQSLSEYIRAKSKAAMAEWLRDQEGVDRSDPDRLDTVASAKNEMGVKLLNAAKVLDAERREGALKRAGRMLRDADALALRAARLRAGEKPLDEWATCRCGGAFQPGERGYTSCWSCSSAEYHKSSYSCIFCDRRHSMSYAACFVCKADGREEDARHLRLVVTRRDGYTCSICGADGTAETLDDVIDEENDAIVGGGISLQVSRIRPIEHGGTVDPWNLETLCGTCQAVRGSKEYGRLDERAFWRMVAAYSGPLFEYLAPDERSRLLALEPDTERETKTSAVRSWPDLGECDESLGELNVVAMMPVGISVAGVRDRIGETRSGPDACKGEVILSTGKRPCRNTTDFREGILCASGCR